MGAPLLQEDAGDREIPCRVAPLQSSTALLPAYLVYQHPYSCTNLVGHWQSCLENLRRRLPPDEPFFHQFGFALDGRMHVIERQLEKERLLRLTLLDEFDRLAGEAVAEVFALLPACDQSRHRGPVVAFRGIRDVVAVRPGKARGRATLITGDVHLETMILGIKPLRGELVNIR